MIIVVTAVILLALAETSFFAERFYSVKKGQRNPRFWKFTWIIAGLIAASTLAPIGLAKWEEKSKEAQRVESLKKRIVGELETNVEILEKWHVILNRRFGGVESLRTSMYVSGALNQLSGNGQEQRIRSVYTLSEDVDRRLSDYRGSGLGYQNEENVRRVKNSVTALINNTTAVLKELDINYEYKDASEQQVIERHINQFQGGVATGNTISADGTYMAPAVQYVMTVQKPTDEDSQSQKKNAA